MTARKIRGYTRDLMPSIDNGGVIRSMPLVSTSPETNIACSCIARSCAGTVRGSSNPVLLSPSCPALVVIPRALRTHSPSLHAFGTICWQCIVHSFQPPMACKRWHSFSVHVRTASDAASIVNCVSSGAERDHAAVISRVDCIAASACSRKSFPVD